MASSLEDLNLPMSVICKIVKESLPDGVSVAKDAKSAIARAASVFVLYLTSRASENSIRSRRKTLNCEDILAALSEIGMGDFIPQVSRTLETYKQLGYKPRATGASKRQNEAQPGGSKQDEFDDDEEELEADGEVADEEVDEQRTGAPKAKRARTSPSAKRPARRDGRRQAEAEAEVDGASISGQSASGSASSHSGSRSRSGSSSVEDAEENRSGSRSRSASGSSRT